MPTQKLTSIVKVLCTSAAFVAFAACSGVGSTPAEQSALTPISTRHAQEIEHASDLQIQSGVANRGKFSGLYVAQFYTQAVGEYGVPDKMNMGASCTIATTEYVNDVGVDSSGTLYVPEQLNGAIPEVFSSNETTRRA
jgi:hypothetical protein